MRLIVRYFTVALLAMGLIAGCNRQTINLKEMTPEQQYEQAKLYFDKKDYYKSKLAFSVIVMNNPGHTIIEKAQFYLAESHFFDKEYILAIEEYEKLIRSIPQSEFVDNARYRVGCAYFNLAPSYHLDLEYTRKAITQFNSFLEEFPNSDIKDKVIKKRLESIDKLATKEYKTGELYRKMGYYRAALISFDAVLKEYADSAMAPDALFWKGECHRTMGDLEDAESTYIDFMRRYPENKLKSRAAKRLKEIQDVLAQYTIK